jgi:hypothetical protein
MPSCDGWPTRGEGNQNDGLWWAAKQAIKAGASDVDLARLVEVYVAISIPNHPRGPNTERDAWRTVESARRAAGGSP